RASAQKRSARMNTLEMLGELADDAVHQAGELMDRCLAWDWASRGMYEVVKRMVPKAVRRAMTGCLRMTSSRIQSAGSMKRAKEGSKLMRARLPSHRPQDAS